MCDIYDRPPEFGRPATGQKPCNCHVAEIDTLRAELKQAQCANQELRDLNVAGKKLGDWIDLTSKLAAAESRAELKQAQEQIDTLLADCQAHGSHIRELQAELKQAEFDIARKARAIIALNESYKALRDGLEPKLAEITGKRNAAESRAEEAERSAEAAEARAEQWERKFNDDGPRCKVRTDSKDGRFIAPTDCGKEDLEQRLAKESRGNCADCSESMLGQLGGFTRIGEYRCYYCKAWFCGDHAFAHFDDHDKGQQRRISDLEQRLARVKEKVLNHGRHAHDCASHYGHSLQCDCWKSAALKELEER
jgi:hypothetical protein